MRDATANNLAEALDFGQQKRLIAPQFSVPRGPFGTVCPNPETARGQGAQVQDSEQWLILREIARGFGWPL